MKLKIKGKKKIQGKVKISGSKNSALAIIAASILSDDEVTIRNIPEIDDVLTQISILDEHGYITYFNDNILKIKPQKKISCDFTQDSLKKLRGSYYFIGSMLSKQKKIKIASFGGCDLGKRPINYHFDSFKKLNIKIKERKNHTILKTTKIIGNKITLPFPSVGATINTILASVKARGVTIIENAALEPEVSDLGNFLISMGAKIEGLSTKTITITGVNSLHGTDYIISSDRIEAGTYLILGALSKGEGLNLENLQPLHLKSLIETLRKAGAIINCGDNSIFIKGNTPLNPIEIETGPYPLFPTDLAPIISVLFTQIEGTSSIKETIFPNRFSHVSELKKTGAIINNEATTLYINGKSKLKSSLLISYDLRQAASLLICAAISQGTSTIENVEFLFRGYEKPIEKLQKLGFSLSLINE